MTIKGFPQVGFLKPLVKNPNIMNGANHQISGFSTYPFYILGNGWESVTPQLGDLPCKGDTVIGSDVWLGYDVLVMPGVTIGDGAIVAARPMFPH